MKDSVVKAVYVVAAVLVSILPFVTGVELSHWMVKMFRGFASVGALFAMIPLALLELTFVIVVGPYLGRFKTRSRMTGRFLRVTGVLLILIFVLESIRFIILAMTNGMGVGVYVAVRGDLYVALAIAGASVGVVLFVVSLFVGRNGTRQTTGPAAGAG